MPPDKAATKNTTDLRRSRQHARAVVDALEGKIRSFLFERGITLLETGRYQEINQIISRLSSRTLRNELVRWLEDRRLTTMARAIRAAFEAMQRALPQGSEVDLGPSTVSIEDRHLNQTLTQIDAGLLYADDDSLATEVGNRVTRQMRLGFAQGENQQELAERIEWILSDGTGEERAESGISGMTVSSKAEMIASDSIQDAYVTAAQRRYLDNGFRYCVYDATVDFKTSDLCLRMNEHVIDMVENPWMLPPLHPNCRSGIRPILDVEGKSVLQEEDIATHFVSKIMQTRSYRPSVIDTNSVYEPTPLTQEI